MRGSSTEQDTKIGAVVRTNVIRLLEKHNWRAAYLYETIGISPGRFWGQFKLKRGPRLALVEKMAEILGIPTYGLLIDPRPDSKSEAESEARQLRGVLRITPADQLGQMFPAVLTPARRGMTCLNYQIWRRVHLYAALIGKTEPEIRRALGVRRATWWSWWRKKSGIAMDDLWLLAAALEVAPWEMLA